MRFYCLTSISKVPPLSNSQYLTEYNNDVENNDEIKELMKYADNEAWQLVEYLWWIDRQNNYAENGLQLKNDMYFNEFMAYRLTEICFGYKFYVNDERRHYVMKIYQNKIRDPFSALMIKGAISLTEIPNKKYEFDLRLSTSKLSRSGQKIGYDFIVKIRNIKNTKTKGLLSEEEEEYYEKYSEAIAEICKSKNSNNPPLSPDAMSDAWEDALEEVSKIQPFKLPNTSKIKFLQQKIRDMKSLIYLLCDPETGNYKNMPLPKIITDPKTGKIKTIPCRFDQKAECLLNKKQKQWRIKKGREGELSKQAKNYRNCPDIFWIEPNLKEINLDDMNFDNLFQVYIKKADLPLSRTFLHPLFKQINFKTVSELRMFKCNILELSDEFFNLLPSTLESLNLSKNNITFISNNISKLCNLKSLYLSKNQNLAEIPWNKLPSNIAELNLLKTNIKSIPPEIQNLTNLWSLSVSSDQLEDISWKNLKLLSSLSYLSIEGGGLTINDINFDLTENTKLSQIKISNIGLKKKIDDSKFPSTNLHFLELPLNKIEHFYLKKDTEAKLFTIDLENNLLKSLSFGEMFLKLTTLFIDQNELTSIEFISFLPNLKILSAKNNKIQEIPEDFSKSLLTIRLDFNEISKLPQNFENFMSTDSKCIGVNTPELTLSFNRFCDNSSNLEEVLWKRLPKKLKFLNLSGNNLVYIPGILSQIQISHLFIDNCNIQHICPIVYTFVSMKDEPRSMIISICDNSELEYLPFVPLSLYQKPPSSKEKISFDYLYNFSFAIITDNESFQNTAKFPMANLKPVYKFEEVSLEEEEQSIGCKCCAICGKATDERAFKNLMIMDFAICFETDEPSCDHSIKSLAFPCFKKGRWKTMVKSRLCQNCKKEFLEANDKAFEKYQKYQKKNQKISNKRKIDATIESNKEQPQIASSSTKKSFYEKELEFHHDDAINHDQIIHDNIADVDLPIEMFIENENIGNQEDMNDPMNFNNYSIPNEQTTFPSTSTCTYYPLTQGYETDQIGMSQNFINSTDNFNNTDNISQSFYQNVHQQNDTYFQQPPHQCQYFVPTPMPIPPSETNTLQNSYIENIVLLDNQGNYVTTLQNNGDIFPESTGYDPRILNPENY